EQHRRLVAEGLLHHPGRPGRIGVEGGRHPVLVGEVPAEEVAEHVGGRVGAAYDVDGEAADLDVAHHGAVVVAGPDHLGEDVVRGVVTGPATVGDQPVEGG